MGSFWTSWQLWEKMCFVLGASIVFVIFLGLLKVAYNSWRLRKYTALAKTKAEQKQAELARHPSVMRRNKASEIPFGIRAIESGIEVDGVWISRDTTPINSIPPSPDMSVTKETPTNPFTNSPESTNRASTISSMSRLEIPQPARSNPRAHTPRKSSSTRLSSNPFERSPSSDLSFSRPGSSYSEVTPRGRPTYQPRRSSHLRFSNAPEVDDIDALATLEGREFVSKLGSKASQGELWQSSGATSRRFRSVLRAPVIDGESESAESAERSNTRSSDESWSASSGDSSLRHPAGLRRHNPSSSGSLDPNASKSVYGRFESSDLDSLASHRKSHVAETGQLFPRVRINGSASEWTSVQQPAEHNNFLSTSPVSPLEPSDPFVTPHATPLTNPMLERSREPPTFEEFVRSTSPQGQFYPATDSVSLQEQHGNTRFTTSSDDINQTQQSRVIKEANQDNKAGEVYRMKNLQRKRQDSGGRKESLFSEAV